MLLMPPPALHPACYVAADPIDQSQVFRSASTCRMGKLFAAAPTSATTGTLVLWMQRCKLSQTQTLINVYSGATSQELRIEADNTLSNYFSYAADSHQMRTSQVFRDTGGFTMLTESFDTADPDAGERRRLYAGGERITAFATNVVIAQDSPITIGSACQHYIGTYDNGSTYPLDAILSEIIYVDGAALPPETFGAYNIHGQWVPRPRAEIHAAIAAAGGFGVNGWHLDFADPFDPGKDVSGRGNHWTATGFDSSGADTVDSNPSNVVAALFTLAPTSGPLVSGGGLVIGNDGTHRFYPGNMRMAADSGLYYCEARTRVTGNYGTGIGVAVDPNLTTAAATVSAAPAGADWLYVNPSSTATFTIRNPSGTSGNPSLGTIPGVPWNTIGVTYGMAYDSATGDVYIAVEGLWRWYAGGAWQSAADIAAAIPMFTVAASSRERGVYPLFEGHGASLVVNFGQWAFAQTPPAGAITLCTDNLPEPKVKDPAEGYAGETATGANILAVLDATTAHWGGDAWVEIIKRREAAESWRWRFSDDPTQAIASDSPNAKVAAPALAAAGSYAGWRLRLGAAYGRWTAEVEHVNGVTTAVTHGLGVARNTVFAKRVSAGGGDWFWRHPDLAAGYLLKLNSAAAAAADGTITAFGADSFQIAAAAPSGTYRVLVMAAIAGHLDIGTYTANGQQGAGATFVPCTIRPDFLLARDAADGMPSVLLDSVRSAENPATRLLYPGSTSVEITSAIESNGDMVDLVVGGFKPRAVGGATNGGVGTVHFFAIGRPVGGICVAPTTAS